MKRVVLESPYSGDLPKNICYARRALFHSLAHGEAPIASHLLYTQVLQDEVPAERSMGISAGLAWLGLAEAQIFYTDLGWSRGMCGALVLGRRMKVAQEFRAIDGPVEDPPL